MIHLAYFSYVYVCCYVMQINYCYLFILLELLLDLQHNFYITLHYVILSVVSLHDSSKTNDLEVFKLDIGMTWHSYTDDMILGQQIKGQGHRVTECKRRSSGRRELCTLLSAQPL